MASLKTPTWAARAPSKQASTSACVQAWTSYCGHQNRRGAVGGAQPQAQQATRGGSAAAGRRACRLSVEGLLIGQVLPDDDSFHSPLT